MLKFTTAILLILSYSFMLFVGEFSHEDEEFSITEPEVSRPNILFIAIDDLNDWTGFLGGHPQAQTPNLDRLAETGFIFKNAFAPSPSCGPSRTAILYGRHPHITGAYGNDDFYSPYTLRRYARSSAIPDIFQSQKSLVRVFSENGYYTAGAGKIDHFTQTPRFPQNTASYFMDDFDTYFHIDGGSVGPDPNNPETNRDRLAFGPVAPEDEEKLRDGQYAEWAVKQLNQDHDKPFFLALGIQKPHLPWVAPQSYFDQFDLDVIQLPNVPENDLDDVPHAGKIFAQTLFFFEPHYSESDHQAITKYPMLWNRLVRAYLASSSYADAMVGKVLDALEASPYADNTIVVIWGDHGWHLGEKQSWRKFTLWERGTRTPLIIRLPENSTSGQVIEQPVSLQDIFPTLIELGNLKNDQKLDGNSLVPLLENPDLDWDKPVLMSLGVGNFAVRDDTWRYIRYQNGDEELYNLINDPGEFTNLIDDTSYGKIIERLEKHIPDTYVKLYNHRSLQFTDVDTMKVFISN